VVHIVRWDGGALPPVYERTPQLPLATEDLVRLSREGFPASQIARMLEERRFAGDVSATALIDLRRSGVPPEAIRAASRHALPPNRTLRLTFEISFEGSSGQARSRYLAVLLPDGPRQRVFLADLGEVLSGHWRQDAWMDETDPLLPRRVRRVTFQGEVPLKTHGAKKLLIVNSTRPDIAALEDIPEADRSRAREFTIDYPPCSLRSECRIRVRYKQDIALPDRWEMVASQVDCEWD
jgi:hypothetical protein